MLKERVNSKTEGMKIDWKDELTLFFFKWSHHYNFLSVELNRRRIRPVRTSIGSARRQMLLLVSLGNNIVRWIVRKCRVVSKPIWT